MQNLHVNSFAVTLEVALTVGSTARISVTHHWVPLTALISYQMKNKLSNWR